MRCRRDRIVKSVILLTQLPGSANERVWGRDQLLSHAYSILENNSPSHILVTGPEGIGKTAFAQALISELIDENRIDQLVWLEKPRSVEYVPRPPPT